MRDYSASSTPRSYRHSATPTSTHHTPYLRSRSSLSEAARRPGKGSVRFENVDGPAVEEGFPDPRTRWIGPGCETPPPTKKRGDSDQEPSDPQPRRVASGRSALLKANGSAFVEEVSSTDDRTLDGLLCKVDRQTPRLNPERQPSLLRKHPQHNSLPPVSVGVPSGGLFSNTRGHDRCRDTDKKEILPSAKLPDPYSNMSDKDSNVEYVEGGGVLGTGTSAGAGAKYPLTKKQKSARHCKGWWWVYLLVFICIVVLVVCLIIFVAIPKIAQSRVNSAKLSIQGISVTQTQSTNFTMSINSTLEADDSIHAVIDAFDGDMYLEDWAPQTPFARVSFPQTTSAALTAVNITQFTQILDMNAFTVFNEWLLVNETLNVSVEGDTKLRVSGISKKYPIHFKKTLAIPGLSNFNGTTVPNSSVSLTADAQGDNFFGTTVIPNRSIVSFEIGNASFINFLLGANVGTIYIDNMVLYPGNNTLSLRGNVTQSPVLTDIQERPYCEDGILPFQLQGLNVTNHGQYLSYYANSLGSTNQSVSIDVGADLEALGLTITCSNTTTKRGTKADSVLFV